LKNNLVLDYTVLILKNRRRSNIRGNTVTVVENRRRLCSFSIKDIQILVKQ